MPCLYYERAVRKTVTSLRKALAISPFMKVSHLSRQINWHCPPLMAARVKPETKNRDANLTPGITAPDERKRE